MIRKRKAAEIIRDHAPSGARRMAARGGKFLGREYSFPSMPATFHVLRSWGYRPSFAIDVGAYVGAWTHEFRQVFPDTKMLLIEPQLARHANLEQTMASSTVRVSNALCGAQRGETVTFYEMETGSSIMQELTDVPRTSVKRSLQTLDALVMEMASDWDQPSFVKLDVQGYELEVLRGASETVSACDFVLLEAAILPYNDGAPMFTEVLQFMERKRFKLVDLCSSMRRSDGALLQTDMLFVREDSEFAPTPKPRVFL